MDGKPARQRSINKRLWKGGSLLALAFAIFIVVNFLGRSDQSFGKSMYGKDFLPTYTAGLFIRQGRLHDIYDAGALSVAEQSIEQSEGMEVRHVYGAWLNPPFAALPAVWLSKWSYSDALTIWTVMMSASTGIGALLLIQMLPKPRRFCYWGLIPLLLFAVYPLWQATVHAQNTPFAFAVLAGTVVFWRQEQPVCAGLMAGLLAYKPQLGRRALLGLAMTGATLLAINIAVLPGSISDYLHQLTPTLQTIQILPDYTWHRHVTWLGFWRILLQGHVGALPTMTVEILADVCSAMVAGALAVVVVKMRHRPESRDRLIVATIVSMPLIMPYYMDYDLTLLAVAGVLCAVDFMATGVDRKTVNAWTMLYLLLEVNPGIAGSTRLVAAVPMLAILAAALIRRAGMAVESVEENGTVLSAPAGLPMAA
jgi:hypothetical protein